MGYGNKTDLAQKSISPSPGAYQVKSTFKNNHYSSIGFGKSRDVVKFGSFLDIIDRSKKMPAPNTYKARLSTLGHKGGRIAMRLPT